jgi:hypothetical protein
MTTALGSQESSKANFRESPKGEVRRIPIPGTSVNKLPVNAPHLSGWHHGCYCPTA